MGDGVDGGVEEVDGCVVWEVVNDAAGGADEDARCKEDRFERGSVEFVEAGGDDDGVGGAEVLGDFLRGDFSCEGEDGGEGFCDGEPVLGEAVASGDATDEGELGFGEVRDEGLGGLDEEVGSLFLVDGSEADDGLRSLEILELWRRLALPGVADVGMDDPDFFVIYAVMFLKKIGNHLRVCPNHGSLCKHPAVGFLPLQRQTLSME